MAELVMKAPVLSLLRPNGRVLTAKVVRGAVPGAVGGPNPFREINILRMYGEIWVRFVSSFRTMLPESRTRRFSNDPTRR